MGVFLGFAGRASGASRAGTVITEGNTDDVVPKVLTITLCSVRNTPRLTFLVFGWVWLDLKVHPSHGMMPKHMSDRSSFFGVCLVFVW